MAFLRRGLVTNKGAVPSVHTRSSMAPVASQLPSNGLAVNAIKPANDHEVQPAIVIKKVSKVLEMAQGNGGYHLVELSCGHQAKSKSTFQGYCTRCRH